VADHPTKGASLDKNSAAPTFQQRRELGGNNSAKKDEAAHLSTKGTVDARRAENRRSPAQEIPKSDGGVRKLGIPTVLDRLIQQAILQVLQPDFDRALVRMFDHQSQGMLVQTGIGAGDQIGVTINAVSAGAPQGTLSTDFGFVDFTSDNGSEVRIARPVAVAETVDGLDDQVAVIRMRQGAHGDKGAYVLKVYRVDDFDGTIDGLKPGDPGYAAATNERAYETLSGKVRIKGPGYLNYKETKIVGVDAGDIIAMKVIHNHHTYYAFASANEMSHGEHVAHLWNYGDNTWGWEGNYKGGDFDYNDLVVQIDFTSAYGDGWLA